MPSILILGAGLSGLVAANQLQKQGHSVVVLEKARGVGGRMATRRFSGGRFDHGAQFFTVRSEEFRHAVADWESAGVVRRWFEGFPSPGAMKPQDTYPRYCAAEGMTAIAKFLADGVDVRLKEEVASLRRDGDDWKVSCFSGNSFEARKLLLTAPLPQSLALLDTGNVVLPEDVRLRLESVRYEPCFAVMALLDGPSKIPAPGALHLDGEPIAWIADNFLKGVSGREGAVTIHSTSAFAAAHYEEDQDAIGRFLIEGAAPYLEANVLEFQVRRWRYSKPENALDVGAVSVSALELVFAGDGLCGARVEGAFSSGVAAARYVQG